MLRTTLLLLALPLLLVTADDCPADKTIVAPSGKKYCDLRQSMSLKKCHEECRDVSFSLPCVESSEDNAFLKTRQMSGKHLWTGLYQAPGSSVSAGWDKWLSPGCSSTYRPWAAGEPNDFLCKEENVAAIWDESTEEGEWVDLHAGDEASCVCEQRPGAGGEESEDERDDEEEGFEEVIEELEDQDFAQGCTGEGRDWFRHASKEDEGAVAPGAFTSPSGTAYYDTGKRGSFQTCYKVCGAMGFTLPTPKTADDANFLAGVRGSVTPHRPATWLGLYQSKHKDTAEGWEDSNWAGMGTSSYRNWAASEPNDYMCVDESCAIANLPDDKTALWYDAPCAWEEPACVCEQRPWQQDAKHVEKFERKVLPRLMRDADRNTCFDWRDYQVTGAFWAVTAALGLSILLNMVLLCCCCVACCSRKKEDCGRRGACNPQVTYGITPQGLAVVQAAIPHQQLPPEIQQQFQNGSSLNVSRSDFVFPVAQVYPGNNAGPPPPRYGGASAPPMSNGGSAPPSTAPVVCEGGGKAAVRWAEARKEQELAQPLYPVAGEGDAKLPGGVPAGDERV